MSDTYHPSSFSIRSASLNLMYVSSLQIYNNTYFTYCQEKNIKIYVFYVDIICRYRERMQTGSRRTGSPAAGPAGALQVVAMPEPGAVLLSGKLTKVTKSYTKKDCCRISDNSRKFGLKKPACCRISQNARKCAQKKDACGVGDTGSRTSKSCKSVQ